MGVNFLEWVVNYAIPHVFHSQHFALGWLIYQTQTIKKGNNNHQRKVSQFVVSYFAAVVPCQCDEARA